MRFFSPACLQGGNAFPVKIGRLFDSELRRLVSCLPSRAVEAKASSTTERYSRAFQKFREWASCHREIIPLPSDEVSVAIYLEFLLQSNCSFSALESACCGINWAHNLYGFPTPCNSSLVRNILEARKRKLESLFPKKSLLFLLWWTNYILCIKFAGPSASLPDLRLAAFCVTAYAACLRFNELAALRCCDVKFCGNRFVEITVIKSLDS